MKKIITISAAILFSCAFSHAQNQVYTSHTDVKDIISFSDTYKALSESPSDGSASIIVTGTGATKEEATKNAFRDAVTQVYGAYVSSNTSILHDNVTKDEIVSIASGNIEGYKELSVSAVPGGKVYVTLDVKVNSQKLSVYAKSKGATVEFNGASLFAKSRLLDANAEAEKKVINNLQEQLISLLPYAFDRKLEILGDPIETKDQKAYRLTFKVSQVRNQNTAAFFKLIKTTIAGMISKYDWNFIKSSKRKTSDIQIWSPINDINGGIIRSIQKHIFDFDTISRVQNFNVLNHYSFDSLDSILCAHNFNFIVKDNIGGEYFFTNVFLKIGTAEGIYGYNDITLWYETNWLGKTKWILREGYDSPDFEGDELWWNLVIQCLLILHQIRIFGKYM